MKATTIKLDGELLKRLESVKPSKESLTSYVRSILEKNLDQVKVREAATAYKAFVEDNPDEKAWWNKWDQADLKSSPRRKKGKS